MFSIRTMALVGFAAVATAACTPGANDPFIGAPPQGTVGRELRNEQINAMRNDPGRAQQNPVATGVSVAGIERQGVGVGGVGAGTPTAVNPGTTGIERAGVGAPPTSAVTRRRVRRPASMRSTTPPATPAPSSTAPAAGTTTR